MATSDRLYEITCEVHDCEERLERLTKECQTFAAMRRACGELVESIEEDRLCSLLPPLSDRTASALSGLKNFTMA